MAAISIPQSMRALQFNQPAQTLELVSSWPTPKPDFELGEHLLKVSSIAITKGELGWPFPPDCYADYSPGVEMSGTVVASPPGSKFPVGSQIYMRTTSPRSGSAREYTIGLERELAFQPKNLTAGHAAAIPVSALTAWQALFVHAGYIPGFSDPQSQQALDQRKKRVLVIGASGSVGIWATQLAAQAGFHVTATCHTRNTAMLQDLGAREVIDYTKTSIRKWIDRSHHQSQPNRFDLVLDCVVPGSSFDAWYAAHPDHGLLLSVGGPVEAPIKWILDRPEGISESVKGQFFIMESSGEQLQKITELVETGRVKPVVDSVFELDDYAVAFERADGFERGYGRKTTGKVVVRIGKD